MLTDYYCQQKFDWIQVRLYDGFVSSCCQAQSHAVKLQDIVGIPIGFFNYPKIVNERKMMLANEKVAGCESCWKFEEKGLASRRTNSNSAQRIYHDTFASPKTVNLVISNTCNQTCVYCCKNFSDSWLRDIGKNGDYNLDGDLNRHQLMVQDRIRLKLGQKELHQSAWKHTILQQLAECTTVEHVMISGGEPFLDNFLVDIIDCLKFVKKITIITGLHVESNRFSKLTDQLIGCQVNNLWIEISGENIDAFHMFNRFGSNYADWTKNYQTVREKFQYFLNSTISNLTMFGISDFLALHGDETIRFNTLCDPEYLMSNLLDDKSKRLIQNQLERFEKKPDISQIIAKMNQPADLNHKPNLRKYFFEFARRRNLDTGIFGPSFLQWLHHE